jgi:hypothetical protein
VSFRGVQLDSVGAASVIVRPGEGPTTPDGFAATCRAGSAFCYYYRAGARRESYPVIGQADLTLWGLGVEGLTVHANARYANDLASNAEWPGTTPTVTLFEGYAQLERGALRARAGRQTLVGRLGYQGFDGARVSVGDVLGALEFGGYAGWGLARGAALPVTSAVLNPLDDFQPRDRQVVVGAEAALRLSWVEASADYRRELDPVPDYIVAERASGSISLRPAERWRLSGGAEYDLANGWWGSADATLAYVGSRFYATAGARRYRPFFDLWTIWGAFSPVPHSSLTATGAVQPVDGVWLRARGERFWYADDEADTPLASVEDRGWRVAAAVTTDRVDRWTFDGGVRAEYGPGASSYSLEGGASFAPRDGWLLSARLGTIDRPLEFRFNQSEVRWYSLVGDIRLANQWRLVTDLGWFRESRARPDAAAFDFDQLRVSTRLVMTLGSSADRLPPAVPRSRRAKP